MAHFSRLEATKVIVVLLIVKRLQKLAPLERRHSGLCWAHVRRDFLAVALNFPTP